MTCVVYEMVSEALLLGNGRQMGFPRSVLLSEEALAVDQRYGEVDGSRDVMDRADIQR